MNWFDVLWLALPKTKLISRLYASYVSLKVILIINYSCSAFNICLVDFMNILFSMVVKTSIMLNLLAASFTSFGNFELCCNSFKPLRIHINCISRTIPVCIFRNQGTMDHHISLTVFNLYERQKQNNL